ncbi:MAG: hypothetical protein AAB395_01755, partial [Patescibacteria group bacterium]
FSFIPIFLYTLLMLMLWVEYSNKKSRAFQPTILFFVLVLLCGIMGTWTLLAPALILPSVILYAINKKPLLNTSQYTLAAALSFVGMIQFYIVAFGHSRDPATFINTAGAITRYMPEMLIVLSVIMSVILAFSNFKKIATRVFFVHIVSIGAFCCSLYVYQLSTKGAIDYYFYKSMRMLVFTLLFTIFVWLVVWLYSKKADFVTELYLGLGAISIILLSFFAIGPGESNLKYTLGHRIVSHADAKIVIDTLSELNKNASADTYLYFKNKTSFNIVGNNIIRSGNVISACENRYLAQFILHPQNGVHGFDVCSNEKYKNLIFVGTKDDVKRISQYITANPKRTTDNPLIHTSY